MVLSRDLFNTITETLEDYSAEFTVREDYSGRGMHYDCCIGFASDNVAAVLVRLGQILEALARDDEDEENDVDFAVLGNVFTNAQFDNMGLSKIVYFPGLQVEVLSDESEDEEIAK